MIRLKSSWHDYFNPVTTLSSVEYNSRQNPTVSTVYISNCLFNKCTSGSDGGALCCSTSVIFLLIESSSFFSCKTSSQYGGAIYFVNTNNGQCVLHGVCGYDCYTTYTSSWAYFQFVYIEVKDDVSSKNYVNYSSIVRCVNERAKSQDTLRLKNGKICFQTANVSMNKCQYYSGILTYPSLDSSSVTCSFMYSSFADNNAFVEICIYFWRENAKYDIKCCNILRNTQGTNSNGLIYAPGNLMIEGSCILENNANYIFYVWSSYTITLSNCTVDKTTNNKNLITQNTVTKSFILGLHHMSTQNCHSGYDSIGTLSAIPYISHPTKKSFCYTVKINHCHGRISSFFSITLMLLVTFIHSNSIQ
jgi:hypothetical protein